jgi:uncharacterized membrane protein
MAQDLKAGPLQEPVGRLKSEARGLVSALGARAASSARGLVEDAAGRLTDYAEDGGGPGLMAAVTGAKNLAEGKGPVRSLFGAGMKALTGKLGGHGGQGGSDGHGKNLKVTSIVESIDVGAPVELAYNQWTQFADFPSFMKKVENVEQVEEQTLSWKAQVLWSHRTWESTILEQVPDDKIIWRSKGAKGYVDGAVTFHELAPSLTRVLLVLEYHPQGFFEHTGNLWRAQGRRARLELKHFRRHVMSEALLHPDEVEGWRGVIQDGEVVQDEEAGPDEDEQAGPERDDQDDTGGQEDTDDQGDTDDQEDTGAPADSHDGQRRPRDSYDDNGDGAAEEAGGGRRMRNDRARRDREPVRREPARRSGPGQDERRSRPVRRAGSRRGG